MPKVFTFLALVGLAAAATFSAQADPLSPNDAEAVDRALAALVADDVVDVQVVAWDGKDLHVPPPFAPGSTTGIAFKPTTPWNGICEATILTIGVDGPADERPGRVTLGTERSVYKVRGNLDPNADEDPGLAAACARDHPLRDGYFDAPDSRTAQDAGTIVEEVRRAMSSTRHPFQLTCDAVSDCNVVGRYIQESTVDRLFSVDEVTPCPQDRQCLELAFIQDNDCFHIWSVEARFRGVGRKGYGLLNVEKLRLKSDDCMKPAH